MWFVAYCVSRRASLLTNTLVFVREMVVVDTQASGARGEET